MITVYDANTKLEDLHHIALRRPEKAGVRWQGIPHGVLANAVVDAVTDRGWKVKETKFSVSLMKLKWLEHWTWKLTMCRSLMECLCR